MSELGCYEENAEHNRRKKVQNWNSCEMHMLLAHGKNFSLSKGEYIKKKIQQKTKEGVLKNKRTTGEGK